MQHDYLIEERADQNFEIVAFGTFWGNYRSAADAIEGARSDHAERTGGQFGGDLQFKIMYRDGRIEYRNSAHPDDTTKTCPFCGSVCDLTCDRRGAAALCDCGAEYESQSWGWHGDSKEDSIPAQPAHKGVLCAICSEPILVGQPISDSKVFKNGELSYIELFHTGCESELNEQNGSLDA